MLATDLPMYHDRQDRHEIFEMLRKIEALGGYRLMRQVSFEYSQKYQFLSNSLTHEKPREFARKKANDFLKSMYQQITARQSA